MVTILLCILSLGNAATYTVSGLGSGAFMASQLHIAYSASVQGAGLNVDFTAVERLEVEVADDAVDDDRLRLL